ncbi:MAG TPA: hypothetical protein PKJ99_14120 [Thermoanaerobaculales bacterium]|mgnify:FL=1|nr:hypothetical protein [Thermoanaerobaculales bacterium]HPA81862.1 hypothetical protein [Thermoanaerobaculales bacterium]HQN97339.1 hypothetical protein [Thermoanaerobaculales bacterium]HQP42946.1 hypothetical protein [Thermoanaerobaculales bacterium]
MIDARAWTRAALVGSLWGALELSVGSVLHLSRIPLSGMVMSAIGLACLLTLRRLSPVPGVCLVAGAVALVVKVFGIGGLFPGPLIGIGAEALLVELAVTALPRGAAAAMAAGALVFLWGPVQKIAMVRIVAGQDAIDAAIVLGGRAAAAAGLGGVAAGWVVGAAVAALVTVGGIAGWSAWRLGGRVAGRLGVER